MFYKTPPYCVLRDRRALNAKVCQTSVWTLGSSVSQSAITSHWATFINLA